MRLQSLASTLFLSSTTSAALTQSASPPSNPSVPSLNVPACPSKATASWATAMPTPTAFPRTSVQVCYTPTLLSLTFTALDEKYFFTNKSYTTNDPIYNYEVMEAFLYHGTNAPTTYMEFEVSPLNVTFTSWIYNPSKTAADDAVFEGAYITDPVTNGIIAKTETDKKKGTWVSDVQIPLAHFSVDEPKGSKWRANFFRTQNSPQTYPAQNLSAWSPNGKPSFHNSLYFGNLDFV